MGAVGGSEPCLLVGMVLGMEQRDYSGLSYWLETCGDDLTPRVGLDTSIAVDVAILGAGYTGLWTAYYLAQRDPSLTIAVLESEIAGYGASGRNGAWCTSGFAAGPATLTKNYGLAASRAVHLAMVDTVDEIGRVCERESIDAQFQRDGQFFAAIGKQQLPALAHIEQEYTQLGFPEFQRRLDASEAKAFLNIDGIVGALHNEATAAIHPGRLVRGLARNVEQHRNVTIYEDTPVTSVEAGARPVLRTARGDVRANVVVLAGEAYMAQLKAVGRQVLPLYSLIVMTEPLSDSQIADINWTHRAVAASQALTVDYLSRTQDGRILFGGRGAPYHWGSSIRPEYDLHAPTHQRLREAVVEWFPQLKGIAFSHAWGGCLGVPRDFMPVMRYDRASGLATARGYTGEGVAATNLSGRVLADLITGTQSDLTDLPMTKHHGRSWEPEPLRFLATRLAQVGAMRIDAKANRTGKPPTGRTLTERLISH